MKFRYTPFQFRFRYYKSRRSSNIVSSSHKTQIKKAAGHNANSLSLKIRLEVTAHLHSANILSVPIISLVSCRKYLLTNNRLLDHYFTLKLDFRCKHLIKCSFCLNKDAFDLPFYLR